MKPISVRRLALDILALFPDGVPVELKPHMMKIMTDLGNITGIIGALQDTAGEVFSQHAKGNTDIAATFFDALLTIEVPRLPK